MYKKKIKKISRKIEREIYNKLYERKKSLNLKQVCKITGLPLPEDKKYKKLINKKFSEPVISWSNIQPNCLYFVFWYPGLTDLKKEDIRKNALFVVTPKPIEGCNNIICENPVEYGLKLFKYIRGLSNAKVVSVTGSVGKTSTKEMIESVLRQKYGSNSMIASAGNSNSSYKAAENIKKLNYKTKVLLQEVGAGSKAYDIVKRSAVILESDIAVYTNIRDSHIEWYGSRENIAKEKFTLSDFGKKEGLAIINYDDEILRKHKFIQEVYSYSLDNKKADVYAKNIRISSEGTTFTIVDNQTKEELMTELQVIGDHHVLNALVAYLVGKRLNVKTESIIEGLKKYKTSGARQNLIDVGKYKVLADCYNSSYDALNSILKTLDVMKTKNKGEKIAVIGDIFELGKLEKDIHIKIGKLLSKFNLKYVIFNGEKSLYSYNEYKKYKNNGIYTRTRQELLDAVQKVIKKDDIILFKASHGMNFAETIDSIFGLEIGERIDLSHNDYKIVEEGGCTYQIFKNHATLLSCSDDKTKFLLPNEIEDKPLEKIGKEAFAICKNLEELILNDNMIRLRTNSFKNTNLKKIKINDNLKSIGSYAFNLCKNLKQVSLPDGLLSIEHRAFYKCENLKKVKIPNSVYLIDENAFEKTKDLIIECKKKSYAEEYAKEHNFKIKYY